MVGKKAKILSDAQVDRLLLFTSTTRNPIRNHVLVLLSLKAGLRAGEIAKLTWPMVLDPSGDIAPIIELRDHAAKKKSGRLIPLHPEGAAYASSASSCASSGLAITDSESCS